MMMGRVLKAMAPFLLLISARLQGQEQNTFAYVESFRKSSTRIRESTYAVDLDLKNPTCAIRVKERNSGRDRYQFNCVPEHPSPGDSRIVGWQIRLADLSHRIYPNVLMPSPDPTQDAKQIGWLDPGKFAKIALTMERVVKVDNFYCIFRVADSHFVEAGQPYLDHLRLVIAFSNQMPHSNIRLKAD
jgi:hypothetical protein